MIHCREMQSGDESSQTWNFDISKSRRDLEMRSTESAYLTIPKLWGKSWGQPLLRQDLLKIVSGVSLARWKLWRSWIVIRANGCPKTQILERSENKRHQFWATQDCPYMLLHQDETKRQILKRMLPIMCSTIYCREIEHLDEAERKVSRQLFPIVPNDPLSWNEASRWNRA